MKVIELIEAIRQEPVRATSLLDAFVDEHPEFPILDGNTATFFFYDGRPAKGVNLMHWVFGLETQQAFTRILGTEAFYLALELIGGAWLLASG